MSVKDEVRKTLCESPEKYISGEQLSENLGVSRAAIWKAVKGLREEGLCIEAVTNKGYILTGSSELVSQEALSRALKGIECGTKYSERCRVFEVTDSTNHQAKKLVLEGMADHGSVVFANQQTAGRGRLGRSFHSPRNGIYMSVVVKPEFDTGRAGLVTVSAAAAAAQAISEICGEDARIKWVNDIYIRGKKVCGILTEAITDFESGSITALIIGIGINTDTHGFPDKLREIAGAVDMDNAKTKAALAARITELVLRNAQQIGAGTPDFMSLYREKSMVLGREIMVYKGGYREDPTVEIGGISAKAVAIDDEGGLRVKYDNGKEETLTTGEVSIRV